MQARFAGTAGRRRRSASIWRRLALTPHWAALVCLGCGPGLSGLGMGEPACFLRSWGAAGDAGPDLVAGRMPAAHGEKTREDGAAMPAPLQPSGDRSSAWREPSSDADALGLVCLGAMRSTGTDGRFEVGNPGCVLNRCMSFGGSGSVAWIPLRDPATGADASLVFCDAERVWDRDAEGRRGDRRWGVRLGVGPSFVDLNFEGTDRDAVGMGCSGSASLLLQVWGSWAMQLRGDVHAWVVIDEHGFHGVGATSLGFLLAHRY